MRAECVIARNARSLGALVAERLREHLRLCEGQFAVGERERLLRDDGRVALVAFAGTLGRRRFSETRLPFPRRCAGRGCGACEVRPSALSISGPPIVQSRLPADVQAHCRARARPPCGARACARDRDCRDRSACRRSRGWRPCDRSLLVTIRRCIAFIFQPVAMNSAASQSSSAGCDGRAPPLPKFSGVATRPRPKWRSQR